MRRFFSGSFVSSLLVPFQISFDTKRRRFCSVITRSKRTLFIIVYYPLCQLLQTRLDKCTRVLFSFRSEWNRRKKRLAFGFLERSRELITRSGGVVVHFPLSYERLTKGKNASLASPFSLYSSFYPFDSLAYFAGKLHSLGEAWSSEDELNIV